MKLALVIHGWPVPIKRDSGLCRLFEENGYSVLAPYLLDGYEFSPEDAVKKLEAALDGNIPDVIVGISMGGLILPLLAKNYPNAKLIFVASGPAFKPGSKKIDFATRFMASIVGEIGFLLMKVIPDTLCNILGFWGNADRSRNNYVDYLKVAERNRKYLKKMSSRVARDVARFLLSVDNRSVLKELDNPALVIFSQDDQQMPEGLAMELIRELAQSDYVMTRGDHFKVLNDETFYRMREFL